MEINLRKFGKKQFNIHQKKLNARRIFTNLKFRIWHLWRFGEQLIAFIKWNKYFNYSFYYERRVMVSIKEVLTTFFETQQKLRCSVNCLLLWLTYFATKIWHFTVEKDRYLFGKRDIFLKRPISSRLMPLFRLIWLFIQLEQTSSTGVESTCFKNSFSHSRIQYFKVLSWLVKKISCQLCAQTR